jgi:hypothetical protein
MEDTNTLAYYDTAAITATKSTTVQAPDSEYLNIKTIRVVKCKPRV